MTRLAEPRPKCCSSHTNGHFDSALPSWSLMTMIAIIVMILKKVITLAELCVLFHSKLSKFFAKMGQLSTASLPRSVSSLKPERVTQYSPRYLLLIRCQIRFVGRFFRLSIPLWVSLKIHRLRAIAPAFRFAQRHHHHHTHFQTGKLKTP